MKKKNKKWWRDSNYRQVASCDSCDHSNLHCGYMWCNLHRTEVYDGRICDNYKGETEEELNGLAT